MTYQNYEKSKIQQFHIFILDWVSKYVTGSHSDPSVAIGLTWKKGYTNKGVKP